MTNFHESRDACYKLAHTIAYNGVMQNKLIDELHAIEQLYLDDIKTIKAMLKVLLSNFT